MSTIRHWLWLTTRGNPAGSHASRLLDYFGSPEAAYHADEAAYDRIQGLPAKVKATLRDKSLAEADAILKDCQSMGIAILTIQDAAYPERLRQIPDPPCVLYVKGTLPAMDEEAAVAIVGARKASPYGVMAARKLGLDLARCGALVVSGMAQGVDAAALKGALSGGGRVVSVLGCGLDVIYPAENAPLYEDVIRAGAVLSEYPPGTPPKGEHFPIRNRILSGLSLGVVVAEGRETSGSLITARLALEQDRDVFAVPGAIDAPLSRGPNSLIRKGEAKLIQDVWDILEEYEFLYPAKLHPVGELPRQAERARLATAAPLTSSPGAPLAPVRDREYWETEPDRRATKQPVRPKTVPLEEPEETAPPPRLVVDLSKDPEAFTDDEAALLRALQGEKARTADELVEGTGIPARRVMSALTMLQVRQLVKQDPGQGYTALVILNE